MASRSRICSGENIRAGPLWFCILEFIILSEESQWKGRVCNITVIFLWNQAGDTIILHMWGAHTPFFRRASPAPHPDLFGAFGPVPFSWGFHPHTPGDFSLAGKVTKRAHRRGTLSTVSPS